MATVRDASGPAPSFREEEGEAFGEEALASRALCATYAALGSGAARVAADAAAMDDPLETLLYVFHGLQESLEEAQARRGSAYAPSRLPHAS